VAACNGHCFGLAVTILPLFDFVYALPGLTFRTPFSELGASLEGCSSVTFPAILGPGSASKMLYYAEPQTSENHLPSGFITEIVQGPGLDEPANLGAQSPLRQDGRRWAEHHRRIH
jgi:Delta3-Delta2-enoyl-CoA isomerase